MSFADSVTGAIEHSAPWITRQRWYGDKARAMTAIAAETVVPLELPGNPTALAIARFSYERGDDADYFVPVVMSGDDARGLRDAVSEPEFLAWFIAGFGDERTLDGGGTWRWRELGDAGLGTLDAGEARVITGEQSNTSVVFGDRAVAKVFRRLQRGLNPDLEIGEFLTRQGAFAHAPRLFGVVELVQDGDATTIAAVQEFVPNRDDGWEWMLGQLRGLDERSRRDLVEAVRLLGMRTGELHVALAADAGNDAFAPERFDDRDARELNRRIVAELSDSVEGLARHITPPEVEALHKGVGQLMSHAQALVGTYRIRVHGDYHLGQTLRTLDDDYSIIDFEGEPSRSIAQRRAKQSALKDVAGMLRSLDYAVATVAGQTDDADRQAWLRGWLTDAQAAFVDAYLEAVEVAPVPLVPEDDERFRQALDLLIAEKALYEARYELNNRPDWLEIPLSALRRLVGAEGG
jgi:trehalose synthase-fused probable maltokinase